MEGGKSWPRQKKAVLKKAAKLESQSHRRSNRSFLCVVLGQRVYPGLFYLERTDMLVSFPQWFVIMAGVAAFFTVLTLIAFGIVSIVLFWVGWMNDDL
jgi:hypothetical protein